MTTTPITKHCNHCDRDLPASAFAANAASADGLQRYCRSCGTAIKREYRRNKAASAAAPAATVSVPDAPRAEHAPPAGLMVLDRRALVASRTNPRKRFDAAFMEELASSIRAHGVAQPLLARPLPGERLQETYTDRRADAPRPTHEIVAGERRWRACEMAGVHQIPVLVRDLTDAAVLELQLVENLQRADLHPMEEAEGYQKLMTDLGMAAEDIAARIGKGTTYVYNTLKLIALVDAAREAFYAGELTRSTAGLLATLPSHLQPEALKSFTAKNFAGDPLSFRAAKALVDDRYRLKLTEAAFNTADASLVPEAGACATCPKRAGANPQLFDDIANGDTCTDPACFAAKKEAHYTVLRARAESRGQTIITGREAREIMPGGQLRGYVAVDDTVKVGGEVKPLREALGQDMPATVLIEHPHTKALVEVLPSPTVGQLLKSQGYKAPADQGEAEAKRKALERYERTWRRRAVERLDAAADEQGANGVSADAMRQIAILLLAGLTADERSHSAQLLGIGKVAEAEGLADHIRSCGEDQIERVMHLLLAQHDMRALIDHSTGKATTTPRLDALAVDLQVDLSEVRAEVKAELRDAQREKRVDAAAAAVKGQAGPEPTKTGRKPRKTAAEASAEIAAGLQDAGNPNAFQPGQRVTVKVDLRRGMDVIATAGKPAEILHAVGDRAWMVQPDHLSFSLSADYTELEVI
ncbi:ParB/RepB/Spo0J family partition protein [Pseudacidovorax sp. NFM-22]|uniref:ParB/RepB/Spo0J family partition protein n=1 Tax=Pseudacidovorax sp. NFM-22 TaxID=2744469 RepID=UPI001F37D12C|nr:ParB/RepB/Spo0J family partition protein [Pseudacidovorax sp. NFM-22]